MSVADRVTECIAKYNANNLVNALIQLCIALDGIAKNEYPRMKKVGEGIKAFIKANQDTMTFFTFNTNIFIDCEFDGYTIEQFIYKVLRCGLLHEGEVSAMFKFAGPGEPTSIGGKQWCLSRTFVFGTLLAVICVPTNARQSVADHLGVTVLGKRFKVNELWGRADLVRKTIGPPVGAG